MSETIIEPNKASSADRDDRLFAIVNYVFFLLGSIIGITSVLGLIIAYARKDKAPNWLHSHYVFQIRTFWYALLALFLSSILVATVILSPIGLLGYLGIWIWVIIRSVAGFLKALDNKGIGDPRGYWV
jgi:uncharacterized membrane protein